MDYDTKLDELLALIRDTNDIRARSQLFKMYQSCRKIYTKLSQEEVECRRQHKITQKYTELEKELDQCIITFEQWVTMSKLMY